MRKRNFNERGVTLVALVLTIIVLIIMAGITVNALIGDNGILEQAKKAKVRHEDESAKEELQFAWSARMSRFYEDLAEGKVSFDKMKEYFLEHKEELNEMLGGNGAKINSIKFVDYVEDGGEDSNVFEISYLSSADVSYKVKMKLSGEIVEFDRSTKEFQEDESSMEELQYVLAIRMSKFREDLENGLTTEDKITEYFLNQRAELNTLFENDGSKIHSIRYDSTNNMFEITYFSSANISYIAKMNSSGNIVEFERIKNNIHYTEVWANYFEKDGVASLIYTIDSLGNTYNGSSNWDDYKNWNITEPATKHEFVPWWMNNNVDYYNKITKVVIEENIIPESTNFMFYKLTNVPKDDMIGLDSLLNRITEIGISMFSICNGITELNIPDGITAIRKFAFEQCDELSEITFPDTLTVIEEYAFFYCKKLTEIELPDSVETIESKGFFMCINLEKVKLSNSLSVLEENVFQSCGSLTEIPIPASVTTIKRCAFSGCNSLNIEIPSTVETIDEYAFVGSSGITITLKMEENAITGSPWGAYSANVVWDPS